MNLLKNETSPYLRQHMDNPVHWMPWGKDALEKAKKEDKPILLSIGYAACHWCHVMAHESFEDPQTAAIMNQHFINIKLDREERPDIDSIYQSALALMGKQGGWPLTMFLMPDGRPFWGGTYFPPQPKYGMPSFREILRGVAESFANDGDKVAHNVRSLAAALEKINDAKHGQLLRRESLDQVGRYFLSLIDQAHGGVGQAPKFPNLPIMNFLWHSYIRTGEDAYKSAVIHSLTQMCQGGIYDHAGGGFSRYAVDEEWLVPHFEKMLYDNAQFISLLSEVYRETKNPLFSARIRQTVDWAQRDLDIEGAFAASLDADSEGVEGKYYVWTAQEIDDVLAADAETFKKFYDVTQAGNWEGSNVLNRLCYPALLSAAEEKDFEGMLAKLKAVRDKRVPPQLDNKILADSNGLMIAALVRAGFALDEPEWIKAAEAAFGFITKNMMDKNNRLLHVWCEGQARHEGLLEDYANMCDAALTLYATTQKQEYLAQAENWVKVLDQDFIDAEAGGYFMASAEAKDLVVRPKTAYDGPVPSGNGTMVGVLARLVAYSGNDTYAGQAQKTAEAFAGEFLNQIFPFPTLFSNSDFLLNPVSLVIMAEDAAAEFRAVLRDISLPSLMLMVLPASKGLQQNHPAAGKTTVDGKITAYLCFGRHCLPPVTSPAALREILGHERHKRHGNAANDG